MDASNIMTPDMALSLIDQAQNQKAKLYDGKDMKRIEKSAREFEAVFVAEMMKPMFEGIETDTMFGGGKGEEIFRSMLLQEYGKEIAKRDVIGIASQVQNELIELQAAQSAQRASGNTQ